MTKSKKTIIISVIPAILTILFIMYVMLPCIGKLGEAKNTLNQEKADFSGMQDKLSSLNNNKKLNQDLQDMRVKLADFNVKIPEEDDMAVFLVDIGKFSSSFNVKVSSLSTDKEKSIEVVDPKEQAKKAKKQSRRKKLEEPPVQLTEIPLEITVIGLYPDLLNFVNALEHYQRKTSINAVTISDYKDEKDTVSKVQMVINASIYKITRQEAVAKES